MKVFRGACAFLVLMLPVAISLSCQWTKQQQSPPQEQVQQETTRYKDNCYHPCKLVVSFDEDENSTAISLLTTDGAPAPNPIVVQDGVRVVWEAQATESTGQHKKKKAKVVRVHFLEEGEEKGENENKKEGKKGHPGHGGPDADDNDRWSTTATTASSDYQKEFTYWVKVKHANHREKVLDPELVVSGTTGNPPPPPPPPRVSGDDKPPAKRP